MRLALFGATGRLGQEILRVALKRGHVVLAHARRPQPEAQSGIGWVTGDVENAVTGTDAVIVTFGPRSPADTPFCSAETQAILDAMRRHGVNRILCVTGAMIGRYPNNRSWCFQQLARWLQRRYPPLMEDRSRQEDLVRRSGLQWIIFKPPRLTTASPRGRCTMGPQVRVGLLSSIPRGDLARVLVEEAEQGRFMGQTVFVKG